MKKFITCIFATIIATVAFSINVNAQNTQNTQNGRWEIAYQKADELKDIPAFYVNVYAEPYNGGYIAFGVGHSVDETFVILRTDKGIFKCHDDQVSVIFYFNEEDNSFERVPVDFIVNDGDASFIYYTWGYNTNGTKSLGEKILNHIKNVGSIMVIAPKYDRENVCFTIPMNPNIK